MSIFLNGSTMASVSALNLSALNLSALKLSALLGHVGAMCQVAVSKIPRHPAVPLYLFVSRC